MVGFEVKKNLEGVERIRQMIIVLLSASVSFVVSSVMMKWHIKNINKLYEGYFDLENSNIKKFSEIVLNKINER